MNNYLIWVSLLLNAVLLWVAITKVPYTLVPFLVHPLDQYIDGAGWFEKHPIDFVNASAVFNTVHGALKQKDNDVFPVGVFFIPAYIPPNTLMYHSTSLPHIPDGYEWIAMDYEFSYNFARFDRGKKPVFRRPPKRPHHDSTNGVHQVSSKFSLPLGNAFLYTFRNTKPLDKLIYLDGASAAKTNTGEMDQQSILMRQKNVDERVDEYKAAEVICEWGKEFGLQGIIRLEIGYEMVLCDFHDGIELAANVSLNNVTDLAHLPYEKPVPETPLETKREKLLDGWSSFNSWEHLKAGGGVDDGEHRIVLDFSNMVTPLNLTWINPDPYKRRIHNLSEPAKEAIISDVRKGLVEPVDPFRKTDWQLLTRRIEEKFAPLFMLLQTSFRVFEENLKEGDLSEVLESAVSDLTRITFNFVRRYSNNNIKDQKAKEEQAFKDAIKDYAFHTFPIATKADSLVFSSLYRVTTEVVGSLFDIYYTTREMLHDIYVEPSTARHEEFKKTLLQKQKDLSDLLGVLRWSIFTRCSNSCAWDEVCYSPTWGPGPMGWGANDKYFVHDGDRYRIPTELTCVSYKDVPQR